jgi:hypothetical protein
MRRIATVVTAMGKKNRVFVELRLETLFAVFSKWSLLPATEEDFNANCNLIEVVSLSIVDVTEQHMASISHVTHNTKFVELHFSK